MRDRQPANRVVPVGRRGKRHPGQMRQMSAGRIAVKYLQQKDLNRHDRIEHRRNPDHSTIETRLGNADCLEFFGPVPLELFNDIRSTSPVSLRCVA